jgi:spindle assembly abnormal protein 6|tara:strand:+ start:549 stop:1487 length:939 start_codon:yes stop_codon:yes gene_type:complete
MSQVLSVLVTSESDPFFFKHADISEEDFQALKVEQSILVDFAQFPAKFIELLDECICCYNTELPRFLAVLRVSQDIDLAGSSLGIIETNHFKHLSHISLSFKSGTDVVIRRYLAARFFAMRKDRDALSIANARIYSEMQSLRAEFESTCGDLATQRELVHRTEQATQARLDELAAKIRISAVEELQNTKKRLERERSASEGALRSAVDSLTVRNCELDAEARKLLKAKYEQDSKLSDTCARLLSAESELKVTRDELDKQRILQEEIDQACSVTDVVTPSGVCLSVPSSLIEFLLKFACNQWHGPILRVAANG